MTPSAREDIIESALRAEFKGIWDWERDVVERPFGPDDSSYVEKFEARVCKLRESLRAHLRSFSDAELAAIRDNPPNEFTIQLAQFDANLTANLNQLRDHRPPPIAYGYGHSSFAPDFTYWCQMPDLNLYEAVVLSVGDDPDRMTADKIYGLKKSGDQRDNLWTAQKFLLKRFEQFTRFFPTTGYGFGQVSLQRLDEWFKEIDLEIPPGFRSALDTRLGEKSTDAKRIQDTLTSQERKTLLKLIAAMACEQYGYDPTATRSEVPSRISEDLDLVGLSMDAKTVRKWLRDAAELVDQSYWTRGS